MDPADLNRCLVKNFKFFYTQNLGITARETAKNFSWDRIVSDVKDSIIETVSNYHLDKKCKRDSPSRF